MTHRPQSAVRSTRRPKRLGSHAFVAIMAIYFIIPLWWLIVAATKSNAGLFNGAHGTMWFDSSFNLIDNLTDLFSYSGGVYGQWLVNSFIYALTGGAGATILAILAGYGFAKYRFPGRSTAFMVLLGSVMVPLTALVIPTFVLLTNMGLTNTRWAVILPSLLNPFGVYLMRVYTQESVPDEMLDAARVDGAGELRTFASVGLPLLRPAIVTVLLLSVVGTWNNFFLPLTMLSDTKLLPVTVGLQFWQAQSNSASGAGVIWNLVAVGALVSIIPLILAFLLLQKYWRGGLAMGSLK